MSDTPQTGAGQFTVLLFAAASTYCGIESLSLAPPMTVKEVLERLEQKFPGITKKVLESEYSRPLSSHAINFTTGVCHESCLILTNGDAGRPRRWAHRSNKSEVLTNAQVPQ